MQQEDDLRALAKVMDFMRAISILFVLIHIYWFCYALIQSWGIDIGVVDRILLNFNRTSGLFKSLLYTKIFAVLFLALSCIGTKGYRASEPKALKTVSLRGRKSASCSDAGSYSSF